MKNGQILKQASAFLLSVTNTLVLTNTLAYYGIRRLRIRNFLGPSKNRIVMKHDGAKIKIAFKSVFDCGSGSVSCDDTNII